MKNHQYCLQLVEFKSTDHILLPGLLYEPRHKTKKAAIFLHGNGSSSVFYAVKQMNILANYLTQKNISFFSFNNRGAHYIHKLKRIKNGVGEELKLGTAYELIKDCLYDIDGAVNYLSKLGYKVFYLMGESTGANKIVVYHYYKPKNKIEKYVLLSGGDDTGLNYQSMGKKKFHLALKKCQAEIKKSNGAKLVPKYLVDYLFSYQSLYDTINPEGDYNIFPFNEYMNNLRLSKKPLFREYKTINKPTLVVSGEKDEYCCGNVKRCVEILKKESPNPKLFTFQMIKDADHGFNGKEEELAKIVSQWLVTSLI